MVKLFVAFHIIIAACCMPCFSQSESLLKVMTWNIRLDNSSDGANQWAFRKEALVDEIVKQHPQVLGVQEALHHQMRDMKRGMKGYKSIGSARDDGKKKGEYSAVFYKKRDLKPIRSGTFWLSQTPEVKGTRGWDAACNRVVSWAEFKDKRTNKHFMVFNTHFDHIGDTARVESARLILRKINELARGLPVIVCGDFNVTVKHRAYRILTFPENEYVLADSRERTVTERMGPDFSFVGFDPQFQPKELIDFIFTTLDIEVVSHMIFDFRKDGKFLSDHLPIIADLKL